VQPCTEIGAQTTVLAGCLPGATTRGFHCEEPTLPDLPALEALLMPGAQPHMLLMAAAGFGLPDQLRLLDAAFPEATKAGSAATEEGALLIGGAAPALHERGMVGVALGGNVHLDSLVSHGAQPVARLLVGDCRASTILRLTDHSGRGGRAAELLDAAEENCGGALALALQPSQPGESGEGGLPAELQPAVLQRAVRAHSIA
jgi:small ligand-binding sensory domain FIST